MKEEIAKMYAQALIDDLAPNVFADHVMRLFSVVGRSEQFYCASARIIDMNGVRINATFVRWNISTIQLQLTVRCFVQ